MNSSQPLFHWEKLATEFKADKAVYLATKNLDFEKNNHF